MADVVSDRLRRASTADRIEADLKALWLEIARAGPVSRAVMSNLVVYSRSTAGERGDPMAGAMVAAAEAVVRHHPARLILLNHEPEGRGDGVLAAQVGILTLGTGGSRYGIEEVVVRTACSAAALPSIVRQLMLGDVPTTVWWTEDLSGGGPLEPLGTLGRQLLYDSRRWSDVRTAVLALAPLLPDTFRPDLADINWRRLATLRQTIVQAFGSRSATDRAAFAPVRIRYRIGDGALAWLLAGWLERAGPPHAGRALSRPANERHGGRHIVPDRASPLPISTIVVDEDNQLQDDVLTVSFGGALQVRLGAHQITVDDALAPPPFVVALPREGEAEAVAAELQLLTHDVCFHETMTALARRFGAA